MQGLIANNYDQKSIRKAKLGNFSQKLKEKYPDGKMQGLIDRLWWPFDKQECEDIIAALSRFTQIFNLSLNISNWYVLFYIATELKYTPRSIFGMI